MSETQILLEKITALRQRLEQVQVLVDDAGSTAAALARPGEKGPATLQALESKVRAGSRLDALLDHSLRRLTDGAELVSLPTQLTTRARRLLERGQELLGRLRSLGEQLRTDDDGEEPLAAWYRATVAMTDSTLRMMVTLPDAPSVQLRLCEGIAVTLEVIAHRIARLAALLDRRRQETTWIDTLANRFARLSRGEPAEAASVTDLAEAVLEESQGGAPLRFLHADAQHLDRFIACHSLNVARVAARLVRHDAEWSRRPLDLVLAALVHDAGMVGLPADLLAQPGPLGDGQRRLLEGHPRTGAEWVGRLWPDRAWLAEAVADHHERLDGTGYPAGLRETQIAPLTRMLAVCDVYAARCAPRPHRPAAETRTALTDTLVLAEGGALDRAAAERLLSLSFYPPAAVVELTDGTVAVVVATPHGRGDLTAPSRPVVSLLTDAQGQPLAAPHHLDLARCDGRGIVRSLSAAERRHLLGDRYPEFV